MTNEQADKIQDVLDEEGIDYNLDNEYSGRGMNGKTCPAFEVEDPMIIAWACGKAGICIIEDVHLHTDSLGGDYIVY